MAVSASSALPSSSSSSLRHALPSLRSGVRTSPRCSCVIDSGVVVVDDDEGRGQQTSIKGGVNGNGVVDDETSSYVTVEELDGMSLARLKDQGREKGSENMVVKFRLDINERQRWKG